MNDLKNSMMLQRANDLIMLSEPLKILTNVDYFALVRIYKDNSHFALGTHPLWLEQFYSRYYKHGVCHKSYDTYNPGFYYLPEAKDQLTHKKMREDFSIFAGIIFVEKYSDYVDIYSFCTTKSHKELSFYVQYEEIWRNYISYFKDKSKKLIYEAESDRLILPKVLPFENKTQALFVSENRSMLKYLSSLLTPREFECALLVKQGLTTAKEIAHKLSITTRTAEQHLDKLRLKLKCKNKGQLIVKLLFIIL